MVESVGFQGGTHKAAGLSINGHGTIEANKAQRQAIGEALTGEKANFSFGDGAAMWSAAAPAAPKAAAKEKKPKNPKKAFQEQFSTFF